MVNKVTNPISSTRNINEFSSFLSWLLRNSLTVFYQGERLHLYTFNVKCLNTDISLENVIVNYISSSENSKSSSG